MFKVQSKTIKQSSPPTADIHALKHLLLLGISATHRGRGSFRADDKVFKSFAFFPVNVLSKQKTRNERTKNYIESFVKTSLTKRTKKQ